MVVEFSEKSLIDLSEQRRKDGPIVYLPPELRSNAASLSFPELSDEIFSHHRAEMRRIHEAIQTNQYEAITEDVAKLLSENGYTEKRNDADYRLLCEFFLKAKMKVSHTAIKRFQMDYDNNHDRLSDRLSSRIAEVTPSATPTKASYTLIQLYQLYVSDKKTQRKLSPATEAKYNGIFKVLQELLP